MRLTKNNYITFGFWTIKKLVRKFVISMNYLQGKMWLL